MRFLRFKHSSSVPEKLESIVAKGFERLSKSLARGSNTQVHGNRSTTSTAASNNGKRHSSRRGTHDSDRRVPHDLRLDHGNGRYGFFRPSSQPMEFDSIAKSSTLYQGTLDAPGQFQYTTLQVPGQSDIPKLQHKLSRVLFSPGVHYLQDPRTQVYNFNPYLQDIMPVDQFDFDAISTFVTASKDETLTALAQANGLKYYASTSSMTGALSQLHFLLSNFRPVSLLDFSRQQPETLGKMTKGARLPATMILRNRNGCYAIDSDKSSDREIVLSLLGHSLERFLTKTPQEYELYKKRPQERMEKIKEVNTYHYAKSGPFLMRSQLDCHDDRLLGTGTFDLKTRAVAAVRHDLAHAEKNLTGYSIVKTKGRFESFERELLELSRSTMLKYSLQARIGNMDGIFIAYHNISKMFGFQYLPLSKMDEILHSFGLPAIDYMDQKRSLNDTVENLSTKMANEEFILSLEIWDKVLSYITNELPNTSFRLIMHTVPISKFESKLRVIATRISDEEVETLQKSGEKLQKLLANASTEEHSEIVRYHVKEIMKLNQSLRHSPVGIEVQVKSTINDIVIRERHPVFEHMDDCWKVDVKLTQMNTAQAIEVYNTCLSEKMNILMNQTLLKTDEDASSLMKVLRLLGENRMHEDKNTTANAKGKVIWNDE